MDILGVGFPELIFVLIIAMMVFGPRRLPEIAGKLGRYVAQLRSLSDGLMAEWQREINAATQLEELEKARQDIKSIQEDFKRTKSDLKQAKQDVDESTKSIAPPVSQPRTSIPSNPAIVQVKPSAADAPAEPDDSDKQDEGNAPIEPDNALPSADDSASIAPPSLPKQENSEPNASASPTETESPVPPSKNGTSPITSSKSQEV
ncbi:MAG: twin-arginine translocase TatA/TatE family subunit [Anaerolineae bacterium]|nr:twin-arginine translocase TatA/TatE family subunit [Anaerolineae bacterium]